MSLTKPTVHLNGTSRESLMRQYEDAGAALNAAFRKLVEASPNARDYYVQDCFAFAAAQREHEDRLARIKSVHDEIEWLLLEVAG